MRRVLWLTTLGLLPAVFPLACGSLNEGQVVIVDENAGTENGGTTSGTAGKGGGGSAGASSGNGGSTSGKGGSVNEAGESGTGTGATGGATGGKGGSSSGGSDNGGDPGTGGTAGNPPSGCTGSSECSGSKPICDDGTCRSCEMAPPANPMMDECRAQFPNLPHCDTTTGQCVECRDSGDCSGSQSVCDGGACRGCQLGSECDSGACNNGRCADETAVVYVADTGIFDPMTCGTRAMPCSEPGTAATLMSESRPFMVILYTSGTFNTSITLPPIDGLGIFGNGVKLASYASPVLTMTGGSVLLDHVVIETDDSTTTTTPFAAVDCTNAGLKILGGSFTNFGTNYSAAALHLTNCNADIHQAEILNSTHGLVSVPDPTAPLATHGLILERSRFQGNREALEIDGDHFIIRNNLFISNGQTSYVRIIRLNSVNPSVFVFNTLYGNDNNCSYEGGLVVCTGAVENCGVQSSNLFWNNMYNGSGGAACPEQVYGSPPPIQYTLAETTWPGTSNLAADPLLDNVLADDYTPSEGSPAIGKAEDADFVPPKDYYGNPRPVGAPDIGAVEVQ